MSDKETKQCPFCGEEILAVAIKCKHCGSDFAEAKSSEAGKAKGKVSEAIGIWMLIIPFISVFISWFWIGNMNLLQRPDSKLFWLTFFTILITAVLASSEAKKLGIGSKRDLNEKGKKKSGPFAWSLFIFFFWILGYPAYLYHRSKYGAKNRLVAGIIVALIFIGNYIIFSKIINAKRAEILESLSLLMFP